MHPAYWLGTMVILLVIELMTMGLTTIWFAGGALAAFLTGILGISLPVQAGVFVAVSLILLVLTRPLAIRYFNSRTQKTNSESLIGQTAVVREKICNKNAEGRVLVNGMEWSARSADGSDIPKGADVIIKEIQGVKLIVISGNTKEV